jgi:hypothetical protein
MEIVSGVAAIALGMAFWDEGAWHWVLIAIGVLGVLPVWGAAAILRKAERDPSVFVSDPQRRRERSRRALLVMVPAVVVIGAAVGYAGGGWGAAALTAAISGASAALGAWWVWRWSK